MIRSVNWINFIVNPLKVVLYFIVIVTIFSVQSSVVLVLRVSLCNIIFLYMMGTVLSNVNRLKYLFNKYYFNEYYSQNWKLQVTIIIVFIMNII